MSPERDSAEHRWPGYLLGGRIRTSTVVLLLAFIGIWWVYETYEPPPAPPDQIPATEVVPPGYVPDPAYTWVPRTDVRIPATSETSTTPTSPTESPTSPAEEGSPTPETPSPTPAGPTATASEPPGPAPATPTRTAAPTSPAPEPARAPG